MGCLVVAVPLAVLVVLVGVVWWVLGDIEPPLIEVSPVECSMLIHCAGERPRHPPVPALRTIGPVQLGIDMVVPLERGCGRGRTGEVGEEG